jgi:predicted permease
MGLSVVSVAVFGLFPAIRASRPNVMDVLRRSGRSSALGQGNWIRNGVVIAEVALSFVLLIGAGLMVRSVMSLYQASPGFDTRGLLTFQLTNQGQAAQGFEARLALARDLTDRLRAVPGVTAVSAASFLPMAGGQEPLTRYGKEEALSDPSKFQQATITFVQPGYFEAMGAPVRDGRTFEARDNTLVPPGVVIDSVLAAKMFPGQRAVGQRLFVRAGRTEPDPFEVIGVVGHQRPHSPASDGREALFFPDATGGGFATGRWVVRTTGDAASLEAAVRREVLAASPRLGLFEVKTMEALVDDSAAGTRFVLWLLTVFAGVAMVLAGVGLYSVLSTAVRQRTAEIGVRIAFGATTRSIFALVVGHGLLLSLAGVAAGVMGAAVLTRAIRSQLVGVSARDPLTFTVIAAAFFVVTIVACALPAWRASHLDPLVALRQE